MSAFVICRTALKRLFRDRSNIFFVLVLPIALVLLIGAQFGSGFQPVVGVTGSDDDPVAVQVVGLLSTDYEIREFDDRDDAVLAVERGQVNAALVFPGSLTDDAVAGFDPEIGFFSQPDSAGQGIRAAVESALDRALGATAAAVTVAETQGISFEEAKAFVEAASPGVAGVEVDTRTTGDALFANLGQFDLGATSQMTLFVFLTGLTGSAALIQSRQLGVTRRMLSTPASARTIIVGEILGRWGVAVFQGLYILVVTLVAFDVNWGDPVAAVAIILLFGAVGAAAAMLFGSIFENDQQAGGISVVAALGLAALGGSMVPVEIFSPGMQSAAKVSPHYWSNDAFTELVRRDGSVVDVLPQLGVLAGFTLVLLTVATWRLQRVITR